MLYMVTFTINIPQMLAYIPYMDPMGMAEWLLKIGILVSWLMKSNRYEGQTTAQGSRAERRRSGPRPERGNHQQKKTDI